MDNEKIVEFDKWCPKCVHKDKKEDESPCDECLYIPARMNSHKPEKWVEKRQ